MAGGHSRTWGAIKETYGVPVAEIQEGIRHGVRKVNIYTDIRLVMTGEIRREMTRRPDEFEPRKWLAAATPAARTLCSDRFEAFGSVGQAASLRRATAG
jgi:fructose-bisphosphate aldolase class II